MILTIFVIVFTLRALAWVYSICRNYLIARQTGLPIVITLIDPTSVLWALTKHFFLPYLALLPGSLGRNSRLNMFGWQVRGRHEVHDRLGTIFVQVTPKYNIIAIGDPLVGVEILDRWEEFPKPREIYKRLEVFGPNVDSVDFDDWRRHRKLTAPCFNERVSSLVWEEGARQANQLIDHTIGSVLNDVNDNCKIIALHVLTFAGFGVRHDYGAGVADLNERHLLGYKDALCTVLSNMPLAVAFHRRVLESKWAPQRWRKIGLALRSFRAHMEQMLDGERNAVGAGDAREERKTPSLTKALIRASQSEKVALTDDEIYGNMFIFNFAGHDTTANTMAFAIALLAIHPDVQAWVAEEVRAVAPRFDREAYSEHFPRLKRIRALMYETLRLYPPISYIPKLTQSRPVFLSIPEDTSDAKRKICIPPHTYVVLNPVNMHTSPRYWGPDAADFRPSRFIHQGGMETETLLKPSDPPEAFMPWATGPRNCVGMKFAQVEFVSVLSALLARGRVEAVVPPGSENGETDDGEEMQRLARERLQRVIDDSDCRVTTTMLRPKDVWVRWYDYEL